MSHDFRQDYEVLALDDGADWATARATYRRQVNVWHPDRYVERPRERVHAQQRFIQLTRSFDSLRHFYRANRRLPFEPIRAAGAPGAAGASGSSEAVGEAAAGADGTPGSAGRPSEEALLEAGILHARRQAAPRRRTRSLLWPAVVAAVMAVTAGVFVVLDRNARQATLDEGREVLRRTAPSEFMPSASEVQKRSSRGTFVEREDGRLGDQLMEDIFK